MATLPLFQSVPEAELVHIATAIEVQYFVEGDVVFQQGDVGDNLGSEFAGLKSFSEFPIYYELFYN